jgi:hypothetical protein
MNYAVEPGPGAGGTHTHTESKIISYKRTFIFLIKKIRLIEKDSHLATHTASLNTFEVAQT